MTKRETIHSEFEEIERENQTYRISTRVKYRIGMEDYVCMARLYKSFAGSVRSRDRLHSKKHTVQEKEDIDTGLKICIDECKEKMNEVEEARSVSVDVSIDG